LLKLNDFGWMADYRHETIKLAQNAAEAATAGAQWNAANPPRIMEPPHIVE
jgi:hypothetical protein